MLLITEESYKNIFLHNFKLSSKILIQKLKKDEQLLDSDYSNIAYDLQMILKYALLETIYYPPNLKENYLKDVEFLEFFTISHTKKELQDYITNYLSRK